MDFGDIANPTTFGFAGLVGGAALTASSMAPDGIIPGVDGVPRNVRLAGGIAAMGAGVALMMVPGK